MTVKEYIKHSREPKRMESTDGEKSCLVVSYGTQSAEADSIPHCDFISSYCIMLTVNHCLIYQGLGDD